MKWFVAILILNSFVLAQPAVITEALTEVQLRLLEEKSDDALRTLTKEQVLAFLTPDERELLATGYLAFTVNTPAIMHVVQKAEAEAPFWLMDGGFERTRVDLGLPEPHVAYHKMVEAGRVGLGVNGLDGAADGDHYFVVLTPRGETPVEVSNVAFDEVSTASLSVGVFPRDDEEDPITQVPTELEGGVLLQMVSDAAEAAALANIFPFLPTEPRACEAVAEPARWQRLVTPDSGMPDPIISAHRGGSALAPENTVLAYEYAFAYGADLVEVDVRETADGQFVAFHDSSAEEKTDGSGPVEEMTFAEVRNLNAASYEPWQGGLYDPAQVASLEEVLEVAARAGKGIEFDIKTLRSPESLASLVARYSGMVERSIFNLQGEDAAQMAEFLPAARFIYNRDRHETPELMYRLARYYAVFGSRMDEYDGSSVAAVHDACGVVVPHAYDEGPENEAQEFYRGRTIGIDGVQTNQPDLILAGTGSPVPTTITLESGRACLVNAENRYGLPNKALIINDNRSRAVVTSVGGCVALEDPGTVNSIAFLGDRTAQSSTSELAGSSNARSLSPSGAIGSRSQ